MDLWQLTLIVLRRWYVFLPLCGLAALGVMRAGDSVAFEYESHANVMLVGPQESVPVPDPTKAVRNNPYLSQGLLGTAQAMQIRMMSQDVRLAMVAAGGTPAYVVTASNRTTIMTVTITASTAQQATVTAAEFPKLLVRELDAAQDRVKAPGDQRVGVEVIDVSTVPAAEQAGLRKAQAVAAGLGLGLAVGAALAVEALAVILRRRRADAVDRRRLQAEAPERRDALPLREGDSSPFAQVPPADRPAAPVASLRD